MAEGSETPGGGFGPDAPAGAFGSEGRTRRSEGDLLAERRARRAVESGEHILARRAEAAEATVRTLEAHVGSLQQRVREAELERTRAAELLAAERASQIRAPSPGEPELTGARAPAEVLIEQELRRLRQREYAEQRERTEVEDRLAHIEREHGAELERLRRRLGDSEAEAGMLAGRLEQLRRELAEAEQSLSAERTALQRAEAELRQRVAELQARADEAERELRSERAARERAERALALVRTGQRRLEVTVEELKAAYRRLKAALAGEAGTAPAPQRAVAAAQATDRPETRAAESRPGAEPTEARAPAAAEARAPAAALRRANSASQEREAGEAETGAANGEMVQALAAAVERLRARAAGGEQRVWAPVARPPRHKHSMSLIGRLRMARKQRRQR